jgi:hypothetical protein
MSLAILASPGIAADFRGSELGGPCNSISERELALGSRELGDPSLLNQHRFSGRAFHRDVIITYLCKDGLLALVNVGIAPRVYDDAVSDFDAIYADLTAMYGSPYVEHSLDPKSFAENLVPRVGGKPGGYSAMWKGKGLHVSVALHVVADHGGQDWVVFAVFTPQTRSDVR